MSLIYSLPEVNIDRAMVSFSPEAREYFEARDAIAGLPETIFDYMVAIWENSDDRVDMSEDEEGDENDVLARRDILDAVRNFCSSGCSKDESHVATARAEVLDIADDYGMEDPDEYEELNLLLDRYDGSLQRLLRAIEALS